MEVEVKIYVIDQTLRRDGWILAELFSCAFMDGNEIEVHKNGEKRRYYAAILTEHACRIKRVLS